MQDTDSIDSRDFEVINELDDGLSVGVSGVTVSHLDTPAHQLPDFIQNSQYRHQYTFTIIVPRHAVRRRGETHTSEQFDLIQSSLGVMRSTLHHLQSHKTLLPKHRFRERELNQC